MKWRRIIAFVMAIAMTLQVGIYENTTRVDAATSGEAIRLCMIPEIPLSLQLM